MAKVKVVHVHETPLVHNTRDFKEVRTLLSAGLAYEVVLVGILEDGLASAEPLFPNARIERLPTRTFRLPANKLLALLDFAETRWRFTPALMRRARGFAWSLRQAEARLRFASALVRLRPDVIHCHSLSPLGACVCAKQRTGAPLIYDAHELETEQDAGNTIRKAVEKCQEKRLIRYCDAVLCVSDAIADWYSREYGIARPYVVRNVPDIRFQSPPGESDLIRQKVGLPGESVVFLYQGRLAAERNVERFIRVFRRSSPDRHFVFMGYGPLTEVVMAAARENGNIHFLPAVEPKRVLEYTAGADVGVVGTENICLNNYYSLPNKLFEYLLAGTGILVPDLPEVRRIVEEHDCGWVYSASDDELLALINGLSRDDILAKRQNAKASRHLYSWEQEEKSLLQAYRSVLRNTQMGISAAPGNGRVRERSPVAMNRQRTGSGGTGSYRLRVGKRGVGSA
jgi:glycosyltransferase involved in cell wall biosynthesis